MIPVCRADELDDNSSKAIEAEGHHIVLIKTNGEIFALEDRCSHQDTPLSGGRVRRGYIACPLHGVMFDVKTGNPTGTLTKKCVRTFDVEVLEGMVHIEV